MIFVLKRVLILIQDNLAHYRVNPRNLHMIMIEKRDCMVIQ
jgi:hypothetical protein